MGAGIRMKIQIHPFREIPRRIGQPNFTSHSGIAFNQVGDYYVATNGIGHLEFDTQVTSDVFSSVFLGSKLRQFEFEKRRNARDIYRSQWVVKGLEFTEISDSDPLYPNRVYTQDSFYTINDAPAVEGADNQHWTHKSWTANPFNESDPRFQVKRNYETKLFRLPNSASQDGSDLFMSTWGDQTFSVYRFEDNNKTAIPAMTLGYARQEIIDEIDNHPWPFVKADGTGGKASVAQANQAFLDSLPDSANQNRELRQATQLFMWRDLNGNGRFETNEFKAVVQKFVRNSGKVDKKPIRIQWDRGRISVSQDGSIWITSNNDATDNGLSGSDGRIYQFFVNPNALKKVAKQGIPTYDASRINVLSLTPDRKNFISADGLDTQGVIYDSDTNTLFVSRREVDTFTPAVTEPAANGNDSPTIVTPPVVSYRSTLISY